MAGHAGRSVHFQQLEFVIAIDHQVYTTPATTANCIEGIHGELAYLGLALGGEITGTLILGGIGKVLGLIVVKDFVGMDANRGQSLITQNRNGVFLTL